MSEHHPKDVEHFIRSCRASDHLQYPERPTVATAFTLDPAPFRKVPILVFELLP
jgi:hypothetical protein